MYEEMHGSRIQYIVQIRIQDYWMDCSEATFQWKQDAWNKLKVLKERKPSEDFQVVKRTTMFKDEILTENQ